MMIIGIQGGQGSFNDQAIWSHLGEGKEGVQIEYLLTSQAVFSALEAGTITHGQVAVHNSTAGLVQETLEAMGRSEFDFIASYNIPISHCLMAAANRGLSGIDTIVSHPQVLAQCQETLARTYPQLRTLPGRDHHIDPAEVGRCIVAGELAPNIATLTCRRVAEIHGLDVLAQDLQDARDNRTTFALLQGTKA